VLRRAIGRGLTSATRLSGGASQETWAVDAGSGADAELLILRRRPGGASAGSGMALPLETEATLLGLAAQAKVPVPAVRHVLASEDGLGSGYLMQRLEGETIPRKILRDDGFADARPARAPMRRDLARIHAIPASLPALRVAPAAVQWREYRDLADGFDWRITVFQARVPLDQERLPDIASVRRTLSVHGDFRHGNLMIRSRRRARRARRELAHRGDPLEAPRLDLRELVAVPETSTCRWAGSARARAVRGLRGGRRRRVDPERVRFWESSARSSGASCAW
jgi:aminoglycoside phosphotransferase (APT) family kinase protein